MKAQKLSKPLEDIGVIVNTLQGYLSYVEVTNALNKINWFTLEIIVKKYCELIMPQYNDTTQYLTSYCFIKPHGALYLNNKVKGGNIQIESKIPEMISQINSDMINLLARKGGWGRDDYDVINNICSKLHSMYRLVKCVDQFGDQGSMGNILNVIEDVWIDMICIVINDFVGKVEKYNAYGEIVEYQRKERDIDQSHENVFKIKCGKLSTIDAKPIYHYYRVKLGSLVSDEAIEHKIIDLITEMVNQKKYNKSQVVDLLKSDSTYR